MATGRIAKQECGAFENAVYAIYLRLRTQVALFQMSRISCAAGITTIFNHIVGHIQKLFVEYSVNYARRIYWANAWCFSEPCDRCLNVLATVASRRYYLSAMVSGTATLDIPFRGARDYVHSTDLFAALERLAEAQLAPSAWLRKLVLRRPAFHQVEAHFVPQDSAFGTFELWSENRGTAGWLVDSRREITRRISFNEAPVRAAAAISPGRVILSTRVEGYTGFEQAIVLLKILCAQIRSGKWLFTAIDLSVRFQEQLPLELILRQKILGRAIVAELQQNRQTIGRAQMVLSEFTGDTP